MKNYENLNLSNFLKIQKEFERIAHLTKPYQSAFDEISRSLQPYKDSLTQINQALELSKSDLVLNNITHANDHLKLMMNKVTIPTSLFEEIQGGHKTWIEKIRPLQYELPKIQGIFQSSFDQISKELEYSNQIMKSLNFNSLSQTYKLNASIVGDLEKITQGVVFTYDKFSESLQTLSELTQLPSFIMPGATREVFTGGLVLKTLIDHVEPEGEDISEELIIEMKEETSFCVQLLHEIDPSLALMHKGAYEAFKGNNPDRTRHILTSLREMWNHLLWNLAPDSSVMNWIPNDSGELIHEGKPTRKARVLYICRDLNNEPLSQFVEQDTLSLVKLIKLFNRLHDREPQLTEKQLQALLLRTDSWVTYIAQISKESN